MDNQFPQNTRLVLSATRRILKPLARLLLANGVTLTSILEVLKSVLVEVAETDFPVKGKATTDSRISLLTGVHRKDVKRLRQQDHQELIEPKSVSLGTQVINAWITEKKWLDKDKRPLSLPKLSTSKGMKSFESLVESISRDVRSRAILDELLRLGVVYINDDDLVQLKADAFVPRNDLEQTLFYLERGVGSHLNAGVANTITPGQQPFFDRMVHYDHIKLGDIENLLTSADEQAMKLLTSINELAKKSNSSQTETPQQFTLGVYVYHHPANKTESGDC